MLEALYDLCTCDSCNCLTLDLIIEDDNLFEPEREEFEISLSTDYFHFYVNPIVMTIIDNESKPTVLAMQQMFCKEYLCTYLYLPSQLHVVYASFYETKTYTVTLVCDCVRSKVKCMVYTR